jgi:hypothetical protein
MKLSAAARVDKVEALIGTGLSDYEIARRADISPQHGSTLAYLRGANYNHEA